MRGRNLITEVIAEQNRTGGLPGGYTFNAFPPDDYEGFVLVVAALRLGDHAHLNIETGQQTTTPGDRLPHISRSRAGRLIMQWRDWLKVRSMLELVPWTRIAEVENPRSGQLTYHIGGSE